MKEIRCPACHTHLTLEQICEDESLRELMGVLADLPRDVSRPLVAYLGLFRGKSRSTAYERQLRLAREALALSADTSLVGAALSETVEAIRVKRDSGDNRPLTNHNYLKRVVESLAARSEARAALPESAERRPAKGVARALAALDAGRQS
ncbi:hypothetical protein [Salinicola rhizosphaerae]|uniref:Uncharacterized protein n=1 Tax=Salinicola rhizosphaerae TaxID=1443141 RepID=A0ABQ3E329_9GAMM|nr:hypothetical protein [Salinicola rhizosphaerae]GHB24228.1 hypothetical protein GCM10009038_24140 [Salinicola rhizosphaerae]